MSVAHVDLLAPELEGRAVRRSPARIALAFGCVAAFALAAVPVAFSLVLLIRPDLLLAR